MSITNVSHTSAPAQAQEPGAAIAPATPQTEPWRLPSMTGPEAPARRQTSAGETEQPRPRMAPPGSPGAPSGGESPLLQRAGVHTPTYSPIVSPEHRAIEIEAAGPAQQQPSTPPGRLSRLTGAIQQAGSTLRQRAGHAASRARDGAGVAFEQMGVAYGHVSQGAALSYGVMRQEVGVAYTRGRAQTVQTGDDMLRAFGPLPRALGIAGAHLLQQAVTCGIPTFAREMVAIGLTMKLAEHPHLAAGLQMAMTTVNMAAHVIRHRRMDRRPDVAARGFHGMTQAQWDATPPDRQAALRDRQQRNSRWVTQMHAAAMVVNTGAMIYGVARKDSERARLFLAHSVANDVRNLVYAAMRETGQASFSVVSLRARNPSAGVNDQRMSTSAFAYTVSQAAGTYVSEAIVNEARTGFSVSGTIIRVGSASGKLASGAGMWKVAAIAASARALTNTLGEVEDAYMGKHHEARQAGGRQVFAPSIPGANQYKQKKRALLAANEGNVSSLQLVKLRLQTFRDNVDISRLLDHSPARMAWNGTAATASDITSFMAPSTLRTALSSFGTAILFGVSYKPVNQTYQAHAAVRSQVRVDAQNEALSAQGVQGRRLDRTWLSRLEVVPQIAGASPSTSPGTSPSTSPLNSPPRDLEAPGQQGGRNVESLRYMLEDLPSGVREASFRFYAAAGLSPPTVERPRAQPPDESNREA